MREMADRIASISGYSNNHTFLEMRYQILMMISQRFRLILLVLCGIHRDHSIRNLLSIEYSMPKKYDHPVYPT